MKFSVAACLGIGALSMLAAVNPARPQDRPSFVQDGHVVVCTTASFPPFTYMKSASDTRPVGIDVDVSDALARSWGATVQFVVTDFPGLLPSLQSGRCGMVISGIYLTDKRRETYDGVPYFTAASVIVTDAGDAAVRSPEDLSGKVVSIEAGTGFEAILTRLNAELVKAGRAPAMVQTYPTPQAATQQVLVRRAAATLTEEAEAAFRIAQTQSLLKIAYTYPSGDKYGIYVLRRPGDLAALRAALVDLRQSGVLKDLVKRNNMPEHALDVDYGS